MYYRNLYNNKNPDIISLHTALFLFLRNYSYSSMFRFNKQGDFNVPYGGISYNNHYLNNKLTSYKNKELIDKLKLTNIFNLDFEEFLINNPPNVNDFIFLDPPYDSDFSTYDNNIFNKDDQIRLSEYLIHKCKGKWLMIIKYTDFIYNLYEGKDGIKILKFDKNYQVSFMNRNDRKVTHLIIKNY